jgi:sortase A
MTRSQKAVVVLLSQVLLIVGITMLGYCTFAVIAMKRYQTQAQDRLATIASPPSVQTTDRTRVDPNGRPESRTDSNGPLLVGRIEIPRIHLSAIIAEGTSSQTLGLAVGHVAGTALPGESGNIVMAAHRDTFFRGLGELQPRDLIRLTAPNGRFDYRVDFTEVVSPAETWVLKSSSNEALTLITCYPFHYIGTAPKRFIVRAYRVDAD